MIEAGLAQQSAPLILEGKRERFAATLGAASLLSLVAEASRQNVRQTELEGALAVLARHKKAPMFDKTLYAQTLLMAGRLADAFALAESNRRLAGRPGQRLGCCSQRRST